MKALLAQLACRVGDLEGNAERAVGALRAHPEADIAIFPELFLSGYTYRDLDRVARTVEDRELEAVASAAAEVGAAVVIGFAERAAEGVANSVACIDRDGSVPGVYRKAYLFSSEADAGACRARSSWSSSSRAARRSAHLLRGRVPGARAAAGPGRCRLARNGLGEHGSLLPRPRRRDGGARTREPPAPSLREPRRLRRGPDVRRREPLDRPDRRDARRGEPGPGGAPPGAGRGADRLRRAHGLPQIRPSSPAGAHAREERGGSPVA